jgi:hypothetical protein
MENYVGYFEIKTWGQGQATTIQLQLQPEITGGKNLN